MEAWMFVCLVIGVFGGLGCANLWAAGEVVYVEFDPDTDMAPAGWSDWSGHERTAYVEAQNELRQAGVERTQLILNVAGYGMLAGIPVIIAMVFFLAVRDEPPCYAPSD